MSHPANFPDLPETEESTLSISPATFLLERVHQSRKLSENRTANQRRKVTTIPEAIFFSIFALAILVYLFWTWELLAS